MTEQDLSSLLDRFEELWANGIRPEIDQYVPDRSDISEDIWREHLLELIMIDLEYCWQITSARASDYSGSPNDSTVSRPKLEDYLARFPELGEIDTLPIEIIHHEIEVRKRNGDHPSRQEVSSRFPQIDESSIATFITPATSTLAIFWWSIIAKA